MKIKLCGMNKMADIDYCNEFLPDYVGFVFAKSRRQVSPVLAYTLRARLNQQIQAVGVFVNETICNLVRIIKSVHLDVIQLHGDEDNDYINQLRCECPHILIIKAVRVKEVESIHKANDSKSDILLLDSFSKNAYGGTGKTADWNLIAQNKFERPFILAGGLNEINILEAIHTTNPYGVDLSSGIETDGIKDIEKIRRIMKLVKG